ncbi:hypothetical protein EO244_03175 [Ancylomarina salipaludis]|uniref:Tetratricopeptide repeat protein n=1 Tax=Ancylomarina salipaludis TaxID=2501299 RepID=A0A4Q1JPC0_9BACT|nr:hypothetical protein [Ancylomarina salipaludis]RXQ96642.1 hypothetical protein EO244_03175 [Ancylomarina salipaludis]
MIQNKDYILKLIEAAGKAITKMIGFKEKGEYTQALDSLNECYTEHFDSIHIETESNAIKLDLYGNLLKEEAEINLKLGHHDKARNLFQKALETLTKAETQSKTFDLKRNVLIQEIRLALKNNLE